MKVHVIHSTTYRYNQAVVLVPHIFRLRPRSNSAQHLLAFHLQITPSPAGTTECLDQDGTLAQNAWFSEPTSDLKVVSTFTVEMLRDDPFNYVLAAEALKLPLYYPPPLATALAPYCSIAGITSDVRRFSESIADAAEWHTLKFLSALSTDIYRGCRQVIRPDGPPWPAAQTWELREGSCRDLAVLFCECCRVAGIAARFVSGYECEAAGEDTSYMHAWAEVYLTGIGWRGYDPARGLAVSNRHIAVAAGFDYDLAAPVAGWYSGSAQSHIEASVSLTVEHDR